MRMRTPHVGADPRGGRRLPPAEGHPALAHEPEPVPIPDPAPPTPPCEAQHPLPGETPFPDVMEGDFVRVGGLPGIVTRVHRDQPLDIRLDVLCWAGRITQTFARIPWTGSGEVPAWDWVGR